MEQSAKFFRSGQIMAFLRYVVTEATSGRGTPIKQYAIAVDALGAPRDFDPETDPLVRVHAQRLSAVLGLALARRVSCRRALDLQPRG